MATWIDRLFTPHTPWLARLTKRGYWAVVTGFSFAFGLGTFGVSLALDETVATSVIVGLLAVVLLLGAGALLWWELRTFWAEPRSEPR